MSKKRSYLHRISLFVNQNPRLVALYNELVALLTEYLKMSDVEKNEQSIIIFDKLYFCGSNEASYEQLADDCYVSLGTIYNCVKRFNRVCLCIISSQNRFNEFAKLLNDERRYLE